LLGEFYSHTAQFLELASDPLHDFFVRCVLAGGQEAIPTGQWLLLTFSTRFLRLFRGFDAPQRNRRVERGELALLKARVNSRLGVIVLPFLETF
jgi:hypothetical protein